MSLGEYRERIDAIDSQLLALFQQRMDVVKLVATYKIQEGLEVLQPQREADVIALRTSQAAPEYEEYAKEFFCEVMRISRGMQERMIGDSKE